MDTALELTGVGKSFGAVRALSDIDLTIALGEVHCVLGENGAGKSTLCNLVYGGAAPDTGEMRLFGERYRPRRPADALGHGIAMVHQHFSLIPTLTVGENLLLGSGAGLRLPRRELAARLARIEDEFGLRAPLATRAEELSVGARQQVEIVKCLLREPRLVLLDEPTAVLGPAEIDALLATCRRIADSGRAVVLVTHKLGEIEQAGDAATVLRGGRVAGSGPLHSFTRAELVELMVGRALGDLDQALLGGGPLPAAVVPGVDAPAALGQGATATTGPGSPGAVDLSRFDDVGLESGGAATSESGGGDGPESGVAAISEFGGRGDPESDRAATSERRGVTVRDVGVAVALDSDGASAGEISIRTRDFAAIAPVLRTSGLRLARPDGGSALDGVDLELRPGEITGIAGVEGNGQSELVAVLSGARRPDAGQFHLAATDLTDATPAARTAHGLGVIPEDRHHEGCVPAMTVAENLTLGRLAEFRRYGLLDRKAIDATAAEVIERHRIKAPGPRAPMRTLSGGNQQKVVVARELALPGLRCLIAAQPTRGLDLGAVDAVLTQLRAAAAAGCAVLLISHELPELLTLCDRILVAYRGRLLGPVTPADPHAREKIANLMLGTVA
ncbi:ABC transporter ATP-binding protein [Nocardia sp. NPDC057668]|uniref:ABC transporter ATP-binding protein n=1 Tax=Nocardia sp. NPDC057668 TaxID=3346202 RepID=UPI00366AD27C